MSAEVKRIVASVLNVSEDQLEDSSGPKTVASWTSLAHVTMVAALEQKYGIQFEMKEMMGIKNIGDLVRLLRAKGVAG